jgi:precorrin-6B methylase 2
VSLPSPARFVPGALKRQHERWSTRRFLTQVNELNHRYADEHGLEVRRGPFEGTTYSRDLLIDSGDGVAKLVGTYELELHPIVEAWIADPPERLVNVGASEGFYAVGFARVLEQTEVLAYDVDPAARARCAELARANGVDGRISIREWCSPETLRDLPPARTVVFCDCEGYEKQLLDPIAAPMLRETEVLAELHDFVDPEVSTAIGERFEATHEIEIVDGEPRDEVVPAELASLEPVERTLLLGERRPGPMQWAWLRPRAA